ncbi:MAG: IPT/TIG domain-containing protein [Bacteroidota bacterium]
MLLRLPALARPLLTCLAFVLPLLIALGCDTEGESLFDPDRAANPDPVLGAVSPNSQANIVLAGIDAVTLTGQNFSTVAEENLVYFNAVRAEVLSATATELVVRAPNTPGESLNVRVAVIGAENYSQGVEYRLISALSGVDAIQPFETPTGIGLDEAGDLFVSLDVPNPGGGGRISTGVFEISPDGMRSVYYDGTLFPWTDLEVGPNDELVGARGIRALFELPEGGRQVTYLNATGVSPAPTIRSFEFAEDGSLWAASGSGILIYAPPGGGSFESFEVGDAVFDVALLDGNLYAAIDRDGMSQVVRFAITGPGSLGAEEPYFSLDPSTNATARRIALAADGTLFVGTDFVDPSQSFRDPVYIVDTSGNGQPLYTGVIGPQDAGERVRIDGFGWDPGTGLYTLRTFITGDGSEDDPITERSTVIRIEARIQGS